MSILIRSMEMPKHGDILVVREYNGKTYIKHEGHLGFEGRIVEVKEPHGRLIDVDELIDGCEKLMCMLDPEGKEYIRVFAIKSYLMWAAEYAVIEAEGETK